MCLCYRAGVRFANNRIARLAASRREVVQPLADAGGLSMWGGYENIPKTFQKCKKRYSYDTKQ